MSSPAVDYSALAKQAGATSSSPAPIQSAGPVDYAALAKQSGSVSYTPPPSPSWLDDVRDTVKQYWNKINPVSQAQGVTDAALHPIDAAKSYGAANGQLAQKAEDAFKAGNYAEGVRHSLSYLLNGIPGLGTALDEAGNKAGSGDAKGAIADTAALATNLLAAKVGPKVLSAATEPGAIPAAIAKVTVPMGDAAKGAWKGGTAPVNLPIHVGPVSVKGGITVPASVAGAATGAGVGALVDRVVPTGAGAIVGGAVGGAYPILKGAINGVREGIANRAAGVNAAAEASAAPAEAAPLPISRQIAAPSAIPMGPIADTSGPIPTDPATGYPLRPGQTVSPAPTVPVAPPLPAGPPLLDQIAQGFKFKDFASMDPAGQATVQKIADSMNKQSAPAPVTSAPPPAAPPAVPAPLVNAAAVPAEPPPAAPSVNAASPAPKGAIATPDRMPPTMITAKQLEDFSNEHGLSADDAEAILKDQNTQVVDRYTLNRTLHAIVRDHDTLHDIAKSTYNVKSLKHLTDEQMLEMVDRLGREQSAPQAAPVSPPVNAAMRP